ELRVSAGTPPALADGAAEDREARADPRGRRTRERERDADRDCEKRAAEREAHAAVHEPRDPEQGHPRSEQAGDDPDQCALDRREDEQISPLGASGAQERKLSAVSLD